MYVGPRPFHISERVRYQILGKLLDVSRPFIWFRPIALCMPKGEWERIRTTTLCLWTPCLERRNEQMRRGYEIRRLHVACQLSWVESWKLITENEFRWDVWSNHAIRTRCLESSLTLLVRLLWRAKLHDRCWKKTSVQQAATALATMWYKTTCRARKHARKITS